MSWWQLDSVLKEAAAYENYYRSVPPTACPHDGTPLVSGPPSQPSILYCPSGDFQYPQDYDVDSMNGM